MDVKLDHSFPVKTPQNLQNKLNCADKKKCYRQADMKIWLQKLKDEAAKRTQNMALNPGELKSGDRTLRST